MDDAFLKQYFKRAHSNHIDASLRHDLASNGQHPEAIIVCCSDSRVSPELIFDAKIGELFVIRTAGNTLGENEFRSIEYAYHHLGVKRCIVLGHTHCGAICSCLEEPNPSNPLLNCIHSHIGCENKPDKASALNALAVKDEIIQRLGEDDFTVYALLYDIDDGHILKLEKEE